MTWYELIFVVICIAAAALLIQAFGAAIQHKRRWGHWPGEHISQPSLKKVCGDSK